MKMLCWSKKVFAGFTLLFLFTGCNLDSINIVKPQAFMPVEKATVEPPAVSEPLKNELKADTPTVSNEPLKVAPVVAVPAETPPVGIATPVTPKVAVQTAPVERKRYDSAPDMEYDNAVLTEDTFIHGTVQVKGWLTVPSQVTLTVEPGTVIRFVPDESGDSSSAGFMIQGRIIASGDAERPVVLTGIYTRPEAGDWQGVVLLASDKKNIIEHCRIEGAGVALDSYHSQLTLRGFNASGCKAAIRLRDSYLNIAGGGVSSCVTGIRSDNSELDLRDMNLSSNRQGVSVSGGSLYLTGSTFYGNDNEALHAENTRVVVSGCSFTVNGTGVVVKGSEGMLKYNRLLNNREAGMVIYDSRLKVTGNNVHQNGAVGLRITGGWNTVWGNVIMSNVGYDLEYTGGSDLAAMGNWWGETRPGVIMSKIGKGSSEGKILIMPVLLQRPQSVQ